jgi:CBS domain containing-hemolysin-like protein
MRPILAIPETKPIDELLKELQKSHTHQAIVMDEYGGTAGLVTLEDIIEELIGEIQDEHDEPPPLEELAPDGSKYSIAATVSIEDVAETLHLPIENPSEYETIGGFALHELRLSPRAGASARLDGYDVTVAEATGRRIRRLLFTKHSAPDAEADAKEAAEEAATASHATEASFDSGEHGANGYAPEDGRTEPRPHETNGQSGMPLGGADRKSAAT